MKSRLTIWILQLQAFMSLAMARRLARGLAWCLWHSGARMVETTRTNLGLCYPQLPDEMLGSLARRSVTESCKTVMEGGAVWLWPAEKIMSCMAVEEGIELLEEAVALGKGVIILAPHYGNWEALGLWLGHCGLAPSYQLYQAPKDQRLDQFIYRARIRTGAELVPTDNKGVASLLKSLRNGGIAGILPDQVPGDSGGEFAPFFGRPALTMTLLSRLVAKTGCRVLLAWASRNETAGKYGFSLHFRAADERLYSKDLQESLRGLNASVEDCIGTDPALYLWEYKRFRRQPKGLLPPY